MLEKLRDKRLMFVGDSLDRGQWISLVCMLQSAIGKGKKSMSPNAPLTIFRAEFWRYKSFTIVWSGGALDLGQLVPTEQRHSAFNLQEYNASVEFHWAPLLVESNSDDPVNHRLADRIIRPETIFKHASLWEKADILIFNTYLWWRQGNIGSSGSRNVLPNFVWALIIRA
ncbi:hypothetical protein ACLOJK_023306 [Asimina triloba]